MTDLSKLYQAIDGRTKGFNGWEEFIFSLDSCADEIAELIKAADRLTDNIAEFDTITDNCFVERLDDAIARLAAKVNSLR